MAGHSSALWRYLGVAFAISWIFWIPVVLATYGLPSFTGPLPSDWFNDFLAGGPLSLSHWLILAGGTLGPGLGAIAGWHRLSGKAGVTTIVRHVYRISLSDLRGWLAGLVPVAMFGLAALIIFLLSGAVIGVNVPVGAFVAGVVAGAFLILGEEMGWRGTQLTFLQETRGALWSSVIVGLTWSLWHLPLLLMFAAPEEGAPESWVVNLAGIAIPYVLMSIPLAIAHTFAFNSARGLVLVPVIAHTLSNAFNADMGPVGGTEEQIASAGGLAGPILLLSFWLIAILLWLVFKRDSLSWRGRVTAESMMERAGTA